MSKLITGLTVRPSYYNKKCLLTWDALPMGGTLQRSPNGLTQWKDVVQLTADQLAYEDTDCFVRNKVVHFYYRIVDPIGNESDTRSAYTIKDHRQNGIINFVVNEELLEMRAGAGIPLAVVNRSNDSEYCPHCTDEETGQVFNSQCSYCGGTGRIGSYSQPVKTLARRLN